MAERESENLFVCMMRETADSWRETPLPAKVCLIVGVAGLLAFQRLGIPGLPKVLDGTIRITSMILMMVGAIVNARSLDEFYQRVYLIASAFTMVVSTVILYGLAVFGVNLGVKTASVIIGVWLCGFVYSFDRLRRA